MCVVSMVHDYMREKVPVENWTHDSFNEFRRILELLDKLDELLGQKECEDPEKAKYLEQIEARLKKLEDENEMRRLKEENAALKKELERHVAKQIIEGEFDYK